MKFRKGMEMQRIACISFFVNKVLVRLFTTSIAHKARDISFTECEKFDTIGDISRERTTGEKTDGKE